jgi:hypothetical protein
MRTVTSQIKETINSTNPMNKTRFDAKVATASPAPCSFGKKETTAATPTITLVLSAINR